MGLITVTRIIIMYTKCKNYIIYKFKKKNEQDKNVFSLSTHTEIDNIKALTHPSIPTYRPTYS